MCIDGVRFACARAPHVPPLVVCVCACVPPQYSRSHPYPTPGQDISELLSIRSTHQKPRNSALRCLTNLPAAAQVLTLPPNPVLAKKHGPARNADPTILVGNPKAPGREGHRPLRAGMLADADETRDRTANFILTADDPFWALTTTQELYAELERSFPQVLLRSYLCIEYAVLKRVTSCSESVHRSWASHSCAADCGLALCSEQGTAKLLAQLRCRVPSAAYRFVSGACAGGRLAGARARAYRAEVCRRASGRVQAPQHVQPPCRALSRRLCAQRSHWWRRCATAGVRGSATGRCSARLPARCVKEVQDNYQLCADVLAHRRSKLSCRSLRRA